MKILKSHLKKKQNNISKFYFFIVIKFLVIIGNIKNMNIYLRINSHYYIYSNSLTIRYYFIDY